MKKLNTVVVLILFCNIYYAYAQNQKLVGNIKGLGNGSVTFIYEIDGNTVYDTVSAVKDIFTYYPMSSDDKRVLLRLGSLPSAPFWYEPNSVTVSGSMNEPSRLVFTGGYENNVLNEYKRVVEWTYERKRAGNPDLSALYYEQEREDALRFIKEHQNSLTGAYLLYWHTVLYKENIETYWDLYKQLSPSMQASFYGAEALKRILIIENEPTIGKPAPNFLLPDTSGATFSLNSIKGKYTLIDFWGHWCNPCIRAFPKLKEIDSTYKESLIVIGVAAEYESDKGVWIKTIKKHRADWIQLSELKADKGDVNTQYNITAFPTYILIDKKGIIIERSLDLETIEKKLAVLEDL